MPDGTGLRVEPQLGLIPLGENPYSGFWEFWAVLTGSRPSLDETTGNWTMDRKTGIVLVLLPGDSSYLMSSDDQIQDQYGRTCVVNLHPFFLSKYEVSQGQWNRIVSENPSLLRAGTSETPDEMPGAPTNYFDLTHPVDSVSWDEAVWYCRQVGLLLPTEAQWEYGCRGGTKTPHWFGDDFSTVALLENFAGSPDPYFFHAPIGSMAPNPFGLFDMHGNVAEWCRDSYRAGYGGPRLESGDGARPPETEEERKERGEDWVTKVYRGGSWYTADWPSDVRANKRPDFRDEDRGLRAAAPLRPCPACD